MASDHPFTPDLLERTLPAHPESQTGELEPATAETVRSYLADALNGATRILEVGAGAHSLVPGGSIVGLGPEGPPLRSNRVLSGRVLADPEARGSLPLRSECFDGAVLVSRLQYLEEPIELFREVHRALRRGGPFVVVLTPKGPHPDPVQIWHRCRNMRERMELGMAYFRFAGGFTELHGVDLLPGRSREEDAVLAVTGRREGTARPRSTEEPIGWRRRGRL